jgi:hypothetical protein
MPTNQVNLKLIDMKMYLKIFVVIGFYASSNNLFAQVSFSCVYREYCNWNEYTEKFGNCQGYEESSLFVMNEAETMFTHTIETMKSTYYVTSKKYDADNDVYTYDVTSDIGNKYFYIFDPKNKEIRAVFSDENEKSVLIRFYVKAIF